MMPFDVIQKLIFQPGKWLYPRHRIIKLRAILKGYKTNFVPQENEIVDIFRSKLYTTFLVLFFYTSESDVFQPTKEIFKK